MPPDSNPDGPSDGEWIPTEGESMRPFLAPGSWVCLQWLDPLGNFPGRIGDLVLCRSDDGTWILHRLLAPDPAFTGRWLVKGDASSIVQSFSKNEIWGRAKAIRNSAEGNPRRFEANWIDFAIALLSLKSVRKEGWLRAALRRMTLTLGWLRQWN